MQSSNMATIGEPVSVLHVKDAILQTANECFDNGHITVTHNTKYISVVEVESQKTVSSWSVRRGQYLTSPTVWSETDGFLTVIDRKEVRVWPKNEVNFEKCKKKHFQFDIHQILTVKGHKPIVVCTNGAVDFLSKIKETHSTGSLEEKNVIIRCQAFVIKSKLCVFCLVKNQDDETHMNCHIRTDDETESYWTCNTTKLNVVEDICSCDMVQFGSDVKCYTLCSTGDLYSHTISLTSTTVNSHRLCSIKNIQKNVAMVILNSTHIALSGIQQDNHIGLCIYDTRFNVLQTFKPFTEPVKDDIKLFHFNKSLFTSHGKTLYMYPYSCQRSTVANILGKPNVINEEDYTGRTITWTKTKKEETVKEENTRNVLQQLSDKSRVSKYKVFKEKFEVLKPLLTSHVSHSNLMLQFVQRCLGEEAFFPKKEILDLIQCQAIPSVLVPQLFDTLIKHREVDLLHTSLQCISDIPESCLCKTLQYILSMEDTDLPRHKCKKPLEDCPLSEAKCFYVNQILQMPFNDVFLVECIRILSFTNVLMLVEYLHYLLTKGPDEIEEVVNNPKLTQVVDWLCGVLDGHFTQLIISSDARVVLVNLHSIVESQVKFYDDLLSLDVLLQQLKSRCAIPQNKMVGQYCIEVLHIL